MRMTGKPMSNRDRNSDTSGKSPRTAPTISGDKSSGVGGRRNAGPAAPSGSVAKSPGGRKPGIRGPGGHLGYHNRSPRHGTYRSKS